MTLYIVVPCYNEEQALPITAPRLLQKLDGLTKRGLISQDSRILLVNDGSSDGTRSIMEELHRSDKRISCLFLSRNFGHQNALMAGLMAAREKCDAAVSMDADLQDDVDAVDEMVSRFLDGTDIVCGVRTSRAKDSAFKRITARGYYRLMSLAGCEIIYDHADYRLLSRRALDALSQYGESPLFLRGIIPQLGFKLETVGYVRNERVAGESKYPLKKMLRFAMDGVTAMSVKPLKWILASGIAALGIFMLLLIIFIIGAFCGHSLLCWKLPLLAILLLGGLVLSAVGITAEYTARLHIQSKDRPRYHVESSLMD